MTPSDQVVALNSVFSYQPPLEETKKNTNRDEFACRCSISSRFHYTSNVLVSSTINGLIFLQKSTIRWFINEPKLDSTYCVFTVVSATPCFF